jgi:iron(III) transport system permease protein
VAVPALVLGLGFLWGWINLPVPVYGTIVVLVMAYSVRFMPQGYRSLSDTLGQVDLDLEDSAYVAGASRVRAVRTITLPLIRVGVVSATLLLFILAVRELTASLFLVTFETRVLAIVLYESWANGAIADVAAISLAYSALLLVITLVARRYFNVKQA